MTAVNFCPRCGNVAWFGMPHSCPPIESSTSTNVRVLGNAPDCPPPPAVVPAELRGAIEARALRAAAKAWDETEATPGNHTAAWLRARADRIEAKP